MRQIEEGYISKRLGMTRTNPIWIKGRNYSIHLSLGIVIKHKSKGNNIKAIRK
jgi:hypothetical protein